MVGGRVLFDTPWVVVAEIVWHAWWWVDALRCVRQVVVGNWGGAVVGLRNVAGASAAMGQGYVDFEGEFQCCCGRCVHSSVFLPK